MKIRYEKIQDDRPIVSVYQIDKETFFVDTFSHGTDLMFSDYKNAKNYALAMFNRVMKKEI